LVPGANEIIGSPIGGYVSDTMVRRLGHPWGRRVPVTIAAICSFVLLLIGSRTEDPYIAIGILALAAGCNSVAAATSCAVPNDLSER
jgi:MFS family permease